MSELIRKQTVLNMIDDVQFGNITNRLSQLHDAVRNTPPVDAVEVVRCKDCIHNQYGFCERVNHNTGYVSTCADVLRAEKRKNDG